MRVPQRLAPLMDQGIIQEVVRPLLSGKEAKLFLVISEGEPCVAKVYKEQQQRSFKHRAEYTEGRRVRNSRTQRAINKRSRYGRALDEAAWHEAEVDAIYRLCAANVRVPRPLAFVEGVLVMEMICDEEGHPAPRLADLDLTRREAKAMIQQLLREVVKMLCAGVVHADLSDFNILLGRDGPVLIDFPQFVDPSSNSNAKRLLLRDVKNLTWFFGRYAPELRRLKYGFEIWDLYQRGQLIPDTPLTGRHQRPKKRTDTASLLEEIEAAEEESRRRREALGLPPPRRPRAPVFHDEQAPTATADQQEKPAKRRSRRRRKKKKKAPGAANQAAGDQAAAPRQAAGNRPKKPRRGPARPARSSQSGSQEKSGSGQEGQSKPARRRRRRRRRS